MAAEEVADISIVPKKSWVYFRGEKIPAGWRHLKQFDNAIVAWDALDEFDDAATPRPTYAEMGIKIIEKIR